MNRFNERYSDIIYQLFHEDTWCSIGYLSEKTSYSKSTIWREIGFMNFNLPPNWSIEKNELKGIRLKKPSNGTIEDVLTYLRENNTYIQIIGLIIFNNGITVAELMEKIHLSRATVYRHIEKIKEVASFNGISISTNRLRLTGDERKIRRFIVQYLEFSNKLIDPSIVDTFNIADFKSKLLLSTEKYSIALHMGALHRLATIMDVINLRISHGCYMKLPKYIHKEYGNSEFYKVASEMFNFMRKCPNRETQMNEALYFSLNILNEKIPVNKSKDIMEVRFRMRGNADDRANLLSIFMEYLANYLGFDIAQDDTFLYKLVQTFRRIYIDSQLGTNSINSAMVSYLPYVESNPLYKKIEDIINKSLIDQDYSDNISVDRMGIFEIFLLVQAALLRKKAQTVITAALICRTFIEAEYIKQVLHYHFGSNLSLTVMDYIDNELLKKNNEYDLVVAVIDTDELNFEHLPIIKISTFPSKGELNVIEDFINSFFLDKWRINSDIFIHL